MLRRCFAFGIAVLGRSFAVTAHAVGRGRDPLSLRQLPLQGGAKGMGRQVSLQGDLFVTPLLPPCGDL